MKSNLSVIHPDAKLGEDVKIDAFVTIHEDVEIGEGSWIGSNAVIMPGTRIGKHCRVFPGAVLGAIPQDLKFKGEYTTLEIGDYVTIREFATINRGTEASGKTIVQDHSLIMSYVHVAHDCIVGRHCVLSAYSGVAGHSQIEDYAILGGYAAVHQFSKIGQHAFIRGGTLVTKDVPPFVIAVRDPVYFSGVNSIGLKRRGFSEVVIENIQEAYRIIFARGLNISQALETIETTLLPSEKVTQDLESVASIQAIVQFIRNAPRGIIKSPLSFNGHLAEKIE